MKTQTAQEVCECVVVGEDGTTIAIAAERFGRKEARDGAVAEMSGSVVLEVGTEALGCVGKDKNPMPLRYRTDVP